MMLIVATASVFFVVYRGFGGFGTMFAQLESEYPAWLTVPGPGFFNINAFVGLTLPWFFFSLSNPQVSKRLFMPRSLGQMRIMVMGFLTFGFIYTLGLWPGVWSALISTTLFIGVSLVTKPPLEKAEEFIGYLQEELNTKKIL